MDVVGDTAGVISYRQPGEHRRQAHQAESSSVPNMAACRPTAPLLLARFSCCRRGLAVTLEPLRLAKNPLGQAGPTRPTALAVAEYPQIFSEATEPLDEALPRLIV